MPWPSLSALRHRRTAVALCVALNACISSALAAVVPVYLVTGLDASYLEASLFMVVSAVATSVVIHILGRIGDHPKRRYSLALVSAACGVVGTLALTATASPWSVLFVFSTLLAVAGSLFPQLMALAFVYDRGATSVIRAIASGGWVVGPLLGGLIVTLQSTAALFATVAAAYTVLAIAFVAMSATYGADGAPDGPPAAGSDGTVPPRGSLPVAVVVLSAIHFLIALFVVAVPWRVVAIGGTPAEVGTAFSIAAAVEVPIIACAGALRRRVGRAGLVLVASFCLAIYFLSAALATSLAGLLAACVFNGLATGLMMGLSLIILHEQLPDRPGYASSIYSNLIRLSYVGALLAAGALAQAISVVAIFWAAGALALALGAALAIRQPFGPLRSPERPATSA